MTHLFNSTYKYDISKKQSDTITLIKYVAAVMVVYIHSLADPKIMESDGASILEKLVRMILDNGNGGILAVATPCFFILSGLLLYNSGHTYFENLKRRLKTLVLPYFVVNLFWIVFFAVFSNLRATASMFADYRISSLGDVLNGLFARNPVYYPFWFVQTLFFLVLFSPVYIFLMEKIPVIYMAVVLICVIRSYSIPYIFPAGHLLWFSLGFYCIKYNVLDFVEKIPSWIAHAMWGVSLFLSINHFRYWELLSVVFGFVSVYKICGLLAEKIRNDQINRLKGYIFPIYACHEYWEAMLKRVLHTLLPQNPVIRLMELLFIPIVIVLMIQAGVRIYNTVRGKIAENKKAG